MKKLLVLILCLSSTMLFAQTLHYEIITAGTEAMQTTVTGVLMIDGVEEYNGDGMHDAGGEWLEIGVFDQDGICRGTKLPTWRAKSNQWIYQLKLRGNAGMTYPTFKVYDHATETEWDVVLDIEETIVWTANGKYGSTTAPYAINFTPNGPAPETFTREIAGYGASNGGYVLLASPVDGADPATSEMIADPAENYDLYYFEQSADLQWINYKYQNYELTVGKGYLYAHKTGTTVTITGTPYTGDGIIALNYNEGAEFAGWNLIGNPFGTDATLDKAYYRMNEDGDGFDPVTENTPVNVMEGVFVKATEEGQTVTFVPQTSKAGSSNIPQTNIAVSRTNGSVIDKAIMRFDGGSTLEKFSFRDSNTKVYIPQGNVDYAIVNSEANGVMPINFKVEETGTYTISFSNEEMAFNYMHLIDNLTGADIDLLIDNSYTFTASVRDNENRFRLVFNSIDSNIDAESDIFAYQSGDEIIVSGEGTMQIFDVMGRFVRSIDVNGTESINAAPFANGVYIFRLIGSEVKTQKIVVR